MGFWAARPGKFLSWPLVSSTWCRDNPSVLCFHIVSLSLLPLPLSERCCLIASLARSWSLGPSFVVLGARVASRRCLIVAGAAVSGALIHVPPLVRFGRRHTLWLASRFVGHERGESLSPRSWSVRPSSRHGVVPLLLAALGLSLVSAPRGGGVTVVSGFVLWFGLLDGGALWDFQGAWGVIVLVGEGLRGRVG